MLYYLSFAPPTAHRGTHSGDPVGDSPQIYLALALREVVIDLRIELRRGSGVQVARKARCRVGGLRSRRISEMRLAGTQLALDLQYLAC